MPLLFFCVYQKRKTLLLFNVSEIFLNSFSLNFGSRREIPKIKQKLREIVLIFKRLSFVEFITFFSPKQVELTSWLQFNPIVMLI